MCYSGNAYETEQSKHFPLGDSNVNVHKDTGDKDSDKT